MCFRPATSVTAVKCIECGAFNKPDNATCQKCGADLGPSKEAAAANQAPQPAAPANISLAPKGLDDKAPAAPGAPTAPGAPKPPVA